MMSGRFAGLIASVGGSAEPLLKTLREHRPQYVLFVVSDGSFATAVNEIEAVMDYAPTYDYLQIPNPNDLESIYRELRDGRVDQWLDRNGLDAADVYLDITGGTKAMSAAVTLAGVETFRWFSYVGGTERDKNNLGTVITGAEYLVSTPNPWDTYAVRDLDRANEMLAGGNADIAASILDAASEKCSPDFARRLERLASLARMMGNTDRFAFTDIPKYVSGQKFRDLITLFPDLEPLGEHWKSVARDLSRSDQTPGGSTLLELFANAERRATQHRYDDAVARIYRAVELYGQQLVKQAFGVELGKMTQDAVPERYRDSFHVQFARSFRSGRYDLGLAGLYGCLEFSVNEKLRAKAAVHDNLRERLESRHQSLLAHGVKQVDRQVYQRLRDVTLGQLELSGDDIPRWPSLEISL